MFCQCCPTSMQAAMVKENPTLEEYGKAIKKACASSNGAWDAVMAQTTVPSGGRWNGAQKQALLAKHFMTTGMFRLITLRISEWASRLAEAAVQLSPAVSISDILSARPLAWWRRCWSYGFDGSTAGALAQSPTHQLLLRLATQVEEAFSVNGTPPIAMEMINQFTEKEQGPAYAAWHKNRLLNEWVTYRDMARPAFEALRDGLKTVID